MKNYQTPRTLAESSFATGYPTLAPKPAPSRAERMAGYMLALVIGVASALLLVHWGAQ